jgi:predicted phage tail protein
MKKTDPRLLQGAGGGGGGFGSGKGGGGGGGAGGSYTPTEARDNLNSTAFANVIDLLGEGEIEGFATPSRLGYTRGTELYNTTLLKDIYFDNTPVLRTGADETSPQPADYNFKVASIQTRYGTQAQDYIPGFDSADDETAVGTVVLQATPVTRTITATDTDAVRVTISIPALQQIKDNGDIVGAKIRLQISVQYNGGGFSIVKDDTISGRTNDQYQRDYIIKLDTINGTITGTYSQAATTVTVTTATPHNLTVGAAFYSDILSGTATSGTRTVLAVTNNTTFTYTAPTSLTTSGNIQLNDSFPVDIRVTRVTADSTSAKLSNSFTWTSFTQIVYGKLKYPNSALVGIRLDAEQFNNIPRRAYQVRGLKIPIPSNATVELATGRLTYAGVWNGTFGAAQWTSDPAWCLYALLTNTRWGFGDHIDSSQLDKWAFYAASQYASALVPDGFGGTEPRFSCNVNIQTSEDAYKLINDLCSTMRAMPYWSVGALTISQDRPQDPTYLFTLANVTASGFSYSGSSLKQRHTIVSVKYFDLETRDVNFEVVEAAADTIAKYGVLRADIEGFACTSRGQARRLGEWLLYSEQNSEIITFTASIEAGVICRPGQVISVQDPMRAGARRAGRISAATTTTITVDNTANTDLSVGGGCTVSVILSDGIVETRDVSTISGGVITVSSAFTSAPLANSIWMLSDDTLATTTWRILGVEEQDGFLYTINAITYDPGKFDFIEQDTPLQTRTITNLNTIPNAPSDLLAQEVFYVIGSRVLTKLALSWLPIKGVSLYRVRYREQNSNWVAAEATGPSFDILDVTAGEYDVEVYAISSTGLLSSVASTLTVEVTGTSAAPADVTGVNLVAINDTTAIISWNLAEELDVLVGGQVLIHHDPTEGVGASWTNSNPIVQSAAGNQTQKQIPLLSGTYFLKFKDQNGSKSANATSIAASLPEPQSRLNVKTWEEENLTPVFSGTSTNMVYSNFYSGLTLAYFNVTDGGEAATNYTTLDTIDGGNSTTNYTLLDTLDGANAEASNYTADVTQTGSYQFKDTLNLGAVYDLNLRRRIVSTPYGFGTLWDDITTLIDDLPDIDGGALDVTFCNMYVRATNDDPAATPTWGPWNEIINGTVRGRGFQLKLDAESESPFVLVSVSELGAIAELQQRVEQSSSITSGAGAYNATFTSNFYQAPTVSITASNMATGDYFTLGTPTRTGFTVTFFNSANAAVSRNFTYTATGFGRQIT